MLQKYNNMRIIFKDNNNMRQKIKGGGVIMYNWKIFKRTFD